MEGGNMYLGFAASKPTNKHRLNISNTQNKQILSYFANKRYIPANIAKYLLHYQSI